MKTKKVKLTPNEKKWDKLFKLYTRDVPDYMCEFPWQDFDSWLRENCEAPHLTKECLLKHKDKYGK